MDQNVYDINGKTVNFNEPPPLTLGNIEALEDLGIGLDFMTGSKFEMKSVKDVRKLVVWGCQLFNQAVTDEDVLRIKFKQLTPIAKAIMEYLAKESLDAAIPEAKRPT